MEHVEAHDEIHICYVDILSVLCSGTVLLKVGKGVKSAVSLVMVSAVTTSVFFAA